VIIYYLNGILDVAGGIILSRISSSLKICGALGLKSTDPVLFGFETGLDPL